MPKREKRMLRALKHHYTVLLLYPDYMQVDGHDTYQAWVSVKPESNKCDEIVEAVRLARKRAVENGEIDAGNDIDFAVLAAYRGHLTDLKGLAGEF